MTVRLFKHTIWIARTREEVFDFFTDFSAAPRWRSYVRSMEPLQEGPLKAGSRIRVTMDLMGSEYSWNLVVIACERPSLWQHHSEESDFTGHVEYRFEPENSGTRVTMSMRVKPRTFYGWLGLPLMLMRRGASYKEQLPQLKGALE